MPITSTPYTAVYGPLSVAGATCTLWLDAADTTQLVFSSGSNVNTWKDKSGFGNSCSNITAGTSITYPGTIVNGLNTVGFTGGCIRGAFNGASANTGTNVTVFMVAAKGGTGVSTTRTFALSDASYTDDTQSTFLIYGPGTTTIQYFRAQYTTGYTIIANTTFLYTVTQTSGSGAQYFNGGSVQTDTITTASFAVTNYNIGTTRFSNSQNYYGPVSEVIVYNAFLGDTQRQAIEGYLAQKWGLTSQLPPGHPGLTQTLYNSKVYQSRVPLSPQPIYQNFNPKQLTGCQLWFDAADPLGTGTAPSLGTTITSWKDKSGNANHATGQVSAVIGFDSTGSYLDFTGSTYYSIGSGAFIANNYFTIFIVERLQLGGSGSQHLIGNSTLGPNNGALHIRYHIGTTVLRFGFFNNDLDGGTIPVFTTADAQPTRIFTFSQLPNSRTVYLNSTNIGSDANNTLLSGWAQPLIGQSFNITEYYTGRLREIIFYTGQLTNSQRQQVEGYLAWKWGLQNSLVSHPYKNVPPGLPWESSLTSSLTRLPPIVATGGTITFSGSYKIHTFTTVGSTNFVVSQVLPSGFSVQLLVVAGGGAGSGDRAAGGGAGGLIFTTTSVREGTYPAIVGAGGTVGIGNVHGTNGSNSSFNGQVAIGGGSGGSHYDGAYIGSTGGSGGGGAAPSPSINVAAGGSGTVGQGFGGGTGYYNTGTHIVSAGGGGGAGGSGSNATTGGGGNGGPGLFITIGGNSAYYAGGGGGAGAQDSGPTVGGTGGIGGGGTAGQSATINATPGTPNTGGGGAGAGNATWGSNASNGGSGIVIIAYNYL